MKRTLTLLLALVSLFGFSAASVALIEPYTSTPSSFPTDRTQLADIRIPSTHGGEVGVWDSNGPRGGKANALAVSPNFANDGVAFTGEWLTNFKGSELGLGIFKSSDAAQTWLSSSQGLNTAPYPYGSAIHAFVFSPNFANDQTVFAATWAGLFKSTNAGASWQFTPSLFFGPPGAITAVAVAPDFPSSGHMLAAGGYGGLHVSNNGGVNWTSNYSITLVSAFAYSPNFATDNTAFAAGFGVYKTIDRGVNWTHLITASTSSLVVSPNFAVDHTLFAAGDAFYTSINDGANWITSTIAPSVTYISALAMSPGFGVDQTLFAGTNKGLYRSDNAGSTWNIVTGTTDIPILSLAISPSWPAHSLLLAGTSHGVYRLAGNTFTLSPGMATLRAESLTVANDESLWLSGARDHGVYASADDGATWSPFGLQDGSTFYSVLDSAISPDYNNDQTLFATRNSNVSIGASINRSTNGGATWTTLYNTDFVPSLAISPNYANDSTIFAIGNTGRVIRSTNGGDNWSQVGDWGLPFSPNVWQVALPPNYSSDATVFAAGQGFYRLPPGASLWQSAASGIFTNTDTSVIQFAVAPNYAQSHTLLASVVWVIPAPPSFDFGYGVYRSTDGGVNWQVSNIGLPYVEYEAVAFSPNFASDNTAYALSASHLYRSTDGGQHWTAIDGPPGTPLLFDLAVKQNGDVIVASSAGVWRYHPLNRDSLIDGDFEANNAWSLPATTVPAYYSTTVVYEGLQAMRIGIDGGSNVATYSSARQTVTIPISIALATLNTHIYPRSEEASFALHTRSAAFRLPVSGDLRAEARDPNNVTAGDAQYVLILEPTTYAISQTLLLTLTNAQVWQPYSFDLTQYAGRTIVLHFGVYNDGAGGRTAMYVDDASLVIVGALPQKVYLPLALQN